MFFLLISVKRSKILIHLLRTCDAGIKFGAQWAGTKIPTFEEAVQLAEAFNGMIVMDLVCIKC